MGAVLSILLTVALIVFTVGIAMRIFRYARTPAPLKIPTMPAPTTRTGVAFRLGREVVLFESLFKASKWTWVFGWLFHAGLFFILLVHLIYITDPIWGWVAALSAYSTYFGVMMLIGLAGLLARRFLVDRVRYISAPSDYLMLVFLMAIAGSGLGMRYGIRANFLEVKQFAAGIFSFELAGLTFNPVLLLHISLVAVLLLIFPFSKLLHAPGVFFSPSRNQVDNAREVRHITPWAKSSADLSANKPTSPSGSSASSASSDSASASATNGDEQGNKHG